MADRSGAARGFTLIEVIVALAIAALALSALFEAASGGLDNADTAAQYVAATRRAQNLLAAVGATLPLRAGEWSAEENGFRWRLTVERATPDGAEPKRRRQMLYAVHASVSWQRGFRTRTVTLDTMRLGAAAGGHG